MNLFPRLSGSLPGADHARPPLPKDPAALRAMLLAKLEACQTLTNERDALAARNEQLPPDQLLFAFEEIEATVAHIPVSR